MRNRMPLTKNGPPATSTAKIFMRPAVMNANTHSAIAAIVTIVPPIFSFRQAMTMSVIPITTSTPSIVPSIPGGLLPVVASIIPSLTNMNRKVAPTIIPIQRAIKCIQFFL